MPLLSFSRTKDFVPGLTPADGAKEALWFVFREQELLADEGGGHVPRSFDAAAPLYVGALSGTPCFAVEVVPETEAPPGTRFAGLRELFATLDPRELSVALTAMPLLTFERTHRFCGVCGTKAEASPRERAKVCPSCGHTCWPRVTPAAIVLVHDGPRVLLTRGKRFPKARWYALVAGFVETGETLEECVAREVREETGVEVDSIVYQGSQPWPFPHQLMLGFYARYIGGELRVDTNELEDAQWFDRSAMPPLPPRGSIAGAMINTWLKEGVR